MKMEEIIFVIENMFPGIVGGTDYLIQESIDLESNSGLGDAKIIRWRLPIGEPTEQQIEEFFEQVKEEFLIQKSMIISTAIKQEEERRQKIVDGYLGND